MSGGAGGSYPREREGVILCFVGPPGTGKTSLGQSIARALGRKFTRMSLAACATKRDPRAPPHLHWRHARPDHSGHQARWLQEPIFMLDEVDKIGMDWRGDPSSALLEVLDPSRTATFATITWTCRLTCRR